ncbi:MAG TPA: cytidylate kinase family protein [Burkholderiales bacterium]|jgi:cytidylate kinase
MAIVAMTREMGSLGKDVAAGLAQELGLPVVHHEIIDSLADKMRLRKSHVIRLLDGQAGILERLTADETSLSIFTEDELCSLAMRGKGAVIRGWGATHLLRRVPHVVRVRVCAPHALRHQRMLERLRTDDADFVDEELRRSDEAQGAIMRRYFNVDWADSSHYDLVLNTERVTVAQCVEEILKLVRSAEFAESDASRRALADVALQSKTRAALRADPRTRPARIVVAVEAAVATLGGLVDDEDQLAAAGEVAASVAGISRVQNDLRAHSRIRARNA